MRIAILGATSQIAKDLVLSFCAHSNHELVLYARRPDVVLQWMNKTGLNDRYVVADFATFNAHEYFDAILNFVGIGDPAKASAMGATIFDVTLKYDEMALNYLHQYPNCRYIFLSSGAAYGTSFNQPADKKTQALIAVNNLNPQDWYGVAKLHAECRHRSLSHLSIVDIRVFNYFSHTQNIASKFLITDILRSIKYGETLITSPNNIVRDYMGPENFYLLISLVLKASAKNDVIDCYTKAPVDKMTLLETMQEQFGMSYKVTNTSIASNISGVKINYFTLNHDAEKYGYTPNTSSLENVLNEVKSFINY
jgi:nucleoside-diphosphate-sugar epimerase